MSSATQASLGLRFLLCLGLNLCMTYLLCNHSYKQQSRPYGPAPKHKSKWFQSQLSHSIEGQGSFNHCYSIIKFVFFQALLGTHGAYFYISITLWLVWKLKVAYDYALEPFRKHPDPIQVSKTDRRLLVTLVELYLSLLMGLSSFVSQPWGLRG